MVYRRLSRQVVVPQVSQALGCANRWQDIALNCTNRVVNLAALCKGHNLTFEFKEAEGAHAQ